MATRKPSLTALFRKTKTVSIRGKNLEFVEPSVIQRAKILHFVLEALSSTLLSDQKRAEMTGAELRDFLAPHLSEFQRLGELGQSSRASGEDRVKLLMLTGSLFSHPVSNEKLLNAIEESFPQVRGESYLLNDESLAEMLGILMTEVAPKEDEDQELYRQLIEKA